MQPRHIRTSVNVLAVLASLCVLFLTAIAIDQMAVSLWLIYSLALSGLIAIWLTAIAGLLGGFPQSNSHKSVLVDLVHESWLALRPFFQDVAYSFLARPRVGLLGVIFSLLVTSVVLMTWPAKNNTLAEKVGIGLGFAGLLFGVLGYNVAVRVDKGIRDSITDFREFLRTVSEILESEILHSRGNSVLNGQNFFPETSGHTGDPIEIPDLILLLWFPYYGLTNDFNGIGQTIDTQLKHIQLRACRTYLISAGDPLSLMTYFNKQYQAKDKRYCGETLDKVAMQLQGKPFEQWDSLVRNVIPSPHKQRVSAEVAIVEDCVITLKALLAPDTGKRFWTAETVDNRILMNGLVQLIWTPRKAAIVFMPPERVNTSDTKISEQTTNRESSPSRHPDPVPSQASAGRFSVTQGEAYKCSGFVTEDPFMNRMIRDLVRIRFGF